MLRAVEPSLRIGLRDYKLPHVDLFMAFPLLIPDTLLTALFKDVNLLICLNFLISANLHSRQYYSLEYFAPPPQYIPHDWFQIQSPPPIPPLRSPPPPNTAAHLQGPKRIFGLCTCLKRDLFSARPQVPPISEYSRFRNTAAFSSVPRLAVLGAGGGGGDCIRRMNLGNYLAFPRSIQNKK